MTAIHTKAVLSVLPDLAVYCFLVGFEELFLLQRMKYRVQGPGTDVIAVSPELLYQPETVDFFLISMMKYMNLDKTQEEASNHRIFL